MMPLMKRMAAMACAAVLCVVSGACQKNARPEARPDIPSPGERVAAPEILRAITLGAGNRMDYPNPADKSGLAEQAEKIVAFAVNSSMNAILYKVNPYGEAVWPSKVLPRSREAEASGTMGGGNDPLAALIDAAARQGVAVYAMLSPYEAGRAGDDPERGSILHADPTAAITSGGARFYRPDNPFVHTQMVNAADELARRYPLTGIAVTDADDSPVSDYQSFYTYLSALVADMSDAVKNSSADMQMGLALHSQTPESGNRTVFLSEACRASVDWIAPTMTQQADATADGATSSPYAQALLTLVDVAQGRSVFTALPDQYGAKESGDALFVNNLLGIYGGVAGDYATLRDDTEKLSAAVPMLHLTAKILPDTSLGFPQEFRITRPLDGQRLSVDRTYETYYITGTSDPAEPVYFGDEQVQRLGNHGLFGVLVEVEEGENEYTFMQSGKIITAALYRPPEDEVSKTSSISTYIPKNDPSSTRFQPYGVQAVSASMPMLFQCVAPAGGKVTATLNGETYELEQTASAEEGTPVTFRKETPIPAPNPDAVTSAGFVTYTLEYQDKISEVEAPGEVFLIGANRKAVLRVKEGIGTVMNPEMQAGSFMTTLKTGSVAEITGQTANYFKTSYGGFILKKSVDILADAESAENQVASVEYVQANDKGDENLILHGSMKPSFIVDESGTGNFTIRLMDTYGVPDGSIPVPGAFFESCAAKNDSSGALTLTFKGSGIPYFGYNVSYDGTDTILSFKAKPRLSGLTGRPLEGLNIVLDPGHGALDSGAFGVPGSTGPAEKHVNLYAAQVMRRMLEGLGAAVAITRETDEDFLELDERVAFTEQHDADFFISVHHNSLIETIDPTRNTGSEVYYYNDISEQIAGKYLDYVTEASGRKKRSAIQDYYVVCRNTLAPSVLLELGYMANAMDYEDICNKDQMLAVARAVCEALVDYIRELS